MDNPWNTVILVYHNYKTSNKRETKIKTVIKIFVIEQWADERIKISEARALNNWLAVTA